MFLNSIGSNLSFPLSCEYCYFNYKFLQQMFEKCTFYEIMRNIEDLFESSTYDLSESAKSAGNQLRILSLVLIQCNTLLNQYPNTSVLQILQRSLNFYSTSHYFSKLIQQYYNETANSSLILPFQLYEPVGSELILNLEEHKTKIVHAIVGGIEDSYIFTLSSTKIIAFNAISLLSLGQINLAPNDYKFHLVFFENNFRETNKLLKEISGAGCLVVADCEIILYYFDREDEIVRRISFGDGLKTNKVFLISSNHCLVTFLSPHNDFCEVYNFRSGDKVHHLKFNDRFKYLECNTPSNYVNNLRHFEKNFHRVYVFVVFEKPQIYIYNVESGTNAVDLAFRNEKTLERDTGNNQIKLSLLAKSDALSADLEFVSCGFIKEMSPYIINSEFFSLTLSSGSIMLIPAINIKDSYIKSKIIVYKPKLKSSKSPRSSLTFKLLESDSNILLVGSNNHLYFTLEKNSKQKLFELAGCFQDAKICWSQNHSKTNVTKLVALSIATVFGYAVNYSKEKDHFVYVQLFKINAHQDYLSFLFVKGYL